MSNQRVQVIESSTTQSVNVVESIYAADWTYPEHSHDVTQACVLLTGVYTEGWDGNSTQILPGDVCLHPAGLQHWARLGREPCASLKIELSTKLEGVLRSADVIPLRPVVIRSPTLDTLTYALRSELRRADEWCRLAVDGLASLFVAEVGRALNTAASSGWIGDARSYLGERFADRPTIAEVARVVGVSPTRLKTGFRSALGCTVGEYLQRLRVRRALAMIQGSSTSLAQVAVDAGFFDQSHMTRCFRRCLGRTPGEVRRDIH